MFFLTLCLESVYMRMCTVKSTNAITHKLI